MSRGPTPTSADRLPGATAPRELFLLAARGSSMADVPVAPVRGRKCAAMCDFICPTAALLGSEGKCFVPRCDAFFSVTVLLFGLRAFLTAEAPPMATAQPCSLATLLHQFCCLFRSGTGSAGSLPAYTPPQSQHPAHSVPQSTLTSIPFPIRGLNFWLSLATLTDWGLLLTIIHHLCFPLIAALPSRFLFCHARLRTAVFHLWPTIFCLQLIILIGFWVSASPAQILGPGAIPAHIVWPFLLFHLALSRARVVAWSFLAPFFTGLLYLAVNGIYTGAVAPVYPQMTWTNGTTAAIIFIGLAIML